MAARKPLRASPPFNALVALELDPGHRASIADQGFGGPTRPTSDGAHVSFVREPDDQARDTFGIALSGGGIRSATYNLGLLQELARHRLIEAFDYLATVSGGGYVGGFWSAWRARAGDRAAGAPFPATPDAATGGGAERPRVESEDVRHLREYGNFLAPRLGLFSYDTGRLIVAALSAAVPSLLAALAFIGLVLALWLVAGAVMLGGPPAAAPWLVPAIVIGAITAVTLVLTEVLWLRRGEEWSWWYVASAAGAVVLTGGLWWAMVGNGPVEPVLHRVGTWPVPLLAEGSPVRGWLVLFVPAGIWMGVALLFVLARWFSSRLCRALRWRAPRASSDRVTSRILFMAATWAAMAAAWILGASVWTIIDRSTDSSVAGFTGLAGTTAALAVLFRAIQRVVSKVMGAHNLGGRVRTWLLPKLPQVAAYATIVAMLVTVVSLIVWLAMSGESTAARSGARVAIGGWLDMAPLDAALLGALLITALTLLLFEPNEIGLHAFYRARIARAFLGAWNRDGRRQTEERKDDDVPLDEVPRSPPLHLVCCAANDLASDDHLGNLHRGAASAVLSPVGFSVGSDWTAWSKNSRSPSLASAVTASGAAFNSHMGSLSMAFGSAVTFVMAALNLRLGMWLLHPTAMCGPWHYRVLPGWQFYRELLGLSRVNGRYVHLSDGGHFENMALYELIRRHCRYIVASDCGADEHTSFDDFGNLVRRVREDFGVEIDIDLSPLRPDEKGMARQPMVAGDIHYPNGDTGVLLLFKPTVVGKEPADITQYRRRNAAFPHESTGDQFYDEAQWESYRRLGVDAARAAFQAVIARCGTRHPQGDRQWAARVFAHARMRWQPMPAGLEARLPRHVDRAGSLDALLQQTGCQLVLREVYREMDALNRLIEAPAEGRGGGNGAAALPAAPALADSLHAIRRAILFMEEVFHTENLSGNYNHPLYLGLLNYFARWAQAPLFRMWWPTLKALYAESFTTFMEQQFGLTAIPARGRQDPELDAAIVTRLTRDDEGLAMLAWRMREDRRVEPKETVISYALQVRYHSATYAVQAAQVVGRVVGTALVWDARHFFVPPGLWGIGIGEDFLDRLATRRGAVFDEAPLRAVEHLVARIPQPRGSRAARKEGADLAQMYGAAGFRARRLHTATGAGNELDLASLGDVMRGPSRWFVRCLRPAAGVAPAAGHGDEGRCGITLVDRRSSPAVAMPGTAGYSTPTPRGAQQW